MIEYLSAWYKRYFTDPQAALLAVLIVVSTLVILYFGKMLAPLIAAIIIAYMLEGAVVKLQEKKFGRLLSVNVVFFAFSVFFVFIVVVLIPIISRQLSQFFLEMPDIINNGQSLLLRLPEQYPELISVDAVKEVTETIKSGINEYSQIVLSFSVKSIPAIITVLVYLILVPLMVFFFLKDKGIILQWMQRFLPTERHLLTEVWDEMDSQIGNYIRGKFYEIIIVGASSYIVFLFMGLNYAPLLGLLVGLSVLIPYIGAAVVTIPIAFVAYFQWGWTSDLFWLMGWYFVIQFLDGNVLVPLLFSEAVNLHPVAIIIAILFFGGLWGFWGIFFAIPLATLVKSLINVWPTSEELSPS